MCVCVRIQAERRVTARSVEKWFLHKYKSFIRTKATVDVDREDSLMYIHSSKRRGGLIDSKTLSLSFLVVLIQNLNELIPNDPSEGVCLSDRLLKTLHRTHRRSKENARTGKRCPTTWYFFKS